jgi:hypothetical protein
LAVKNLDLVDWTIREAQLLIGRDGSLERTDRDDPFAPVSGAEAQTTDENVDGSPGVRPSQETTSADLPAANEAATSTFAKAQFDAPLAALRKAIVEPGIDTSREDRSRAIALRWMLRDIKNDRLKWWPIEQHDLWLMVELGLVEMRDNQPILTNAGVDIVI